MNNDIELLIKKCKEYEKYRNKNFKKPLIPMGKTPFSGIALSMVEHFPV